MRIRDLAKVLSHFLFIFTLLLIIPILVALYYEFFTSTSLHPPYIGTLAFVTTFGASLSLFIFFRYIGRRSKGELFRRESLLLVPLVWVITSILSALPFLISNTIENPIDAFFESVSGLTTTGSSVIYPKAFDQKTGEEIPVQLTTYKGDKVYYFKGTVTPIVHPETKEILFEGLSAVNPPILFWRSFLQWIGGLGVIFLFIAVFPALAIGGKFLYEAEITGPFKEAITPRIKETASNLWKIYLGLTILEILSLRVFNHDMPFFDALTITFSNISTGGFSIKAASIGAYNSPATEWIVLLFMILGAINFGLYFFCIKGKIYKLYEPEFFLFLVILILGSLFVTTSLIDFQALTHWTDKIRAGSFQFVSSITCTGFFTKNYDLWPFSAQSFMLLAMFIGGMSGSTAGGIKIVRHLIIFRAVKNKIESLFRPEAVQTLVIGKKEVSQSSLANVFVFFWVIIALSAFGTLILILDGIDPKTAFGLITCSINNVGLSFSAAGPSGTCAILPLISKVVMIIWMLFGRLEFFALLVLFSPSFWRSN
ncbi:MAG: potassium transporter TrkG [Simkaniaceae bacterium]